MLSKRYKIAVFQQRNGLYIRNLQQREIKYRRCEIRFYLKQFSADLRKVFACTVTYYCAVSVITRYHMQVTTGLEVFEDVKSSRFAPVRKI